GPRTDRVDRHDVPESSRTRGHQRGRRDVSMSVFVCADGAVSEHAAVEEGIDIALALATGHARVGIACGRADAIRVAARALPGMVVCPRDDPFECVDCYPLSETTSLVRPCKGSSSRAPVARNLRSSTPRATPLAPTTS